MAFPAVVTSVFVGIVTAGAAAAEPSEPPTCSFTVTPPQLVQVSGADMVAATVAMASCDGLAAPISSVACIQAEGSDSAQECAEGRGMLPAQVYYQPYRPGTTYVSEGRGCAIVTAPPGSTCQSVGPLTATL
jgi:hypothetical protein